MQNASSSNSLTTSMEDETKSAAEFLVTVPFHTKKWLVVPTLYKENLGSLSLVPEQTLQYGALDPIKDSISKTLASEVGKSLRTGKLIIGRIFSILLT